MTSTGSPRTRLLVVRGNSGSGKSSIARELRAAYGRGLAIIEQDYVRRTVLKEKDVPGAAAIGLIDLMARHALDSGFHTVVEGILYADRYGAMLTRLVSDHVGVSRCYYLDVPFPVTLERHASRPTACEFGEREMRAWWRPRDLLPGGAETVIDEHSTLDQSLERILTDCGLQNPPGEESVPVSVR
ncbi:kinase [Nocardiopsis dassonvillei]|uniref:AAA family ATPase n=1 Tax=Nocardiopsis dassonvillei TaxID=2014 RepID=UPI002010BF22|nr:AAA family ATPase [Nocardiopsis dassonvillei]MCK9868609.1 kinase [Nocardiopsis dassonvillei]